MFADARGSPDNETRDLPLEDLELLEGSGRRAWSPDGTGVLQSWSDDSTEDGVGHAALFCSKPRSQSF